MLKIDRKLGKLERLHSPTFDETGFSERGHLQELILRNPDAFFMKECGESLFVIRSEVVPSPEVNDRIDILALDTQGKMVIIELKRGSNKLQLLQALTYAAMVSRRDWPTDLKPLVNPELRAQLDEFTDKHGLNLAREINQSQRIILVAEEYDYEVLSTAEWLTNHYGMDITCYDVSLALDREQGVEYLSALQLFPPRKLAKQARLQGYLRSQAETRFPSLDARIEGCTSPIIKAFFSEEKGLHKRRNLRNDSIVVPDLGKMRIRFTPRRDYARIAQLGRFQGDEAMWRKLSSDYLLVRPNGLRYRLYTDDDIKLFRLFLETELLRDQAWQIADDSDAEAEDDEVSD